jgi:hypothetical protein
MTLPVEPDSASAVFVSTIAVVLASIVVLVDVVVVLVPVVVALVPADVRPEADVSPVVVEVGDGPDPDDPLVVLGPLEPPDSLPVGWKHAKSPKPKGQSAARRRRGTHPK